MAAVHFGCSPVTLLLHAIFTVTNGWTTYATHIPLLRLGRVDKSFVCLQSSTDMSIWKTVEIDIDWLMTRPEPTQTSHLPSTPKTSAHSFLRYCIEKRFYCPRAHQRTCNPPLDRFEIKVPSESLPPHRCPSCLPISFHSSGKYAYYIHKNEPY